MLHRAHFYDTLELSAHPNTFKQELQTLLTDYAESSSRLQKIIDGVTTSQQQQQQRCGKKLMSDVVRGLTTRPWFVYDVR